MERTIILISLGVILTIIIELIVLYIEKVRDKRLWLSIPINIVTNLILNVSLSFIRITWLYTLLVIIGEIIVFFVEWLFYQLLIKDKKNWIYSLTCNLISFILGSLILYLFTYLF